MKDLPGIDTTVSPSGPGCVECDEAGGWWYHLRRCALCGHVGCCDASPEQHARRHWEASGHPLAMSYEPGEFWFWSFTEEAFHRGPDLAPPDSRPQDQPAPGPAGRVPPDWQSLLNP